jgi:hypothetical protein
MKKHPNPIRVPGHQVGLAGTFTPAVIDAMTRKTVRQYPEQRNMILDQGIDAIEERNLYQLLEKCVAGTGTTPTKDTTGGTYSQSGTTVTRESGSYNFSAGDEGKKIWFTDGSFATILTALTTTTATVDKTQTVATQAADLYRTNQTALANEVAETTTVLEYGFNNDTPGRNILTITYDFPTESGGAVIYTEAGVSRDGADEPIINRVLFDSPVSVQDGQLLRLTFSLTLDFSPAASTPFDLTDTATGWPHQYQIQSITGDGTGFDVVLNEAPHFDAGDTLTIADALPATQAITVGTSTGSEFTITVAGHGYSPADQIVIAGCTPGGYNGTWTIASTTTDTITVTTAADPGPMTGLGTVRLSVPTPWFTGAHTIDSITDATVRVTGADYSGYPDAGTAGIAYTAATGDCWHFPNIANIPAAMNNFIEGTSDTVEIRRNYSHMAKIHDPDETLQAILIEDNTLAGQRDPSNAAITSDTSDWWDFSTWPVAGTEPNNANFAGPEQVIEESGTINNGDWRKGFQLSKGSYTSGSGVRTDTVTFIASAANSERIKAILFCSTRKGSDYKARPTGLIFVFDHKQRKADTHQLTLQLTRTFYAKLA